MARFLLLICLFFPSLALAEIDVSLPDYMGMREVSGSVSPAQRAQMARISHPNEMIALFFPQDAPVGSSNIPDDLVIIAVPKGDPQVSLAEFPLLKDELRPKLRAAGTIIFEDNARWLGTIKAQAVGQKTYLLSSAIISLQDHVLMVQYLRAAQGGDDIQLLQSVVGDIAAHLVRRNPSHDLSPFQTPRAATPAPAQSDTPQTKKTPLFVPRSSSGGHP